MSQEKRFGKRVSEPSTVQIVHELKLMALRQSLDAAMARETAGSAAQLDQDAVAPVPPGGLVMAETPTHLFAVGERVSLALATLGRSEGADVFTVKARMPHVGTQLQYRVKAENEPYERVVTEGQLTRFGARG